MATYDLLMIAILGGLTLYGYFKGMAWQVAYIASFVASYFVAVRFADRVAPQITFVNPPANKFVAMLLIYVGTSFVIWMLFRMVRNAIDSVKMEGFDHQMGAIIGFARGVLWCVAVTFFAMTLAFVPGQMKQQIVASRSGYYIARLVDETDTLFPPEVHQVVGPYLDRLGSELDSPQNHAPAIGQPASPGGWPSGGGWPDSGSPAPAAPAPAWGAAPAPSAPSWQPQAPAQGGWPTTDAAPARTPAQQASWPKWPE
ncbi:CvpA family protein [Botrimarina sp.]|uniref:CvpA family protein n=1 Tax=Botrimarina sp. TaxID=2795802 RepID=UPI0032EC29D8